MSTWHLQQINLGGNGKTAGPTAVIDPSAFVYAVNIYDIFNGANIAFNQSHVLYNDAFGRIWDSWYDGDGHWNLQQINLAGSGKTTGPAAGGDPSFFVYSNQAHVLYRDAIGTIWDSWYDGDGHWKLQQINLGGNGKTTGPAAGGDPSSFVYSNQSHVLYRDESGMIWDSWYDGDGHWKLQQINLGGNGKTTGPAAGGDPSSFVYSNQSHVLYRDESGVIWDSFYA
jgi:hypothetical protein